MRSRPLAPVPLAVLLVLSAAGCSPEVAPESRVVGTSELAPENHRGAAGDGGKDTRAAKATKRRPKPRPSQDKANHRGDRGRSGGAATGGQDPSGERDGASTATPEPVGPLRAAVSDPTGDVRGTLTGAPPYADLTGAALTRGDVFEVRVSFAGAVPQRQGDDRIVQVATFYDLDGDGATDYEVWASLADNGWGTSYRTPDQARYGDDSGATARPEGDDLVITFPLGHLEGAESLSWAVGAQWGTLEQVSSGTTSKDNAPDGGWARLRR